MQIGGACSCFLFDKMILCDLDVYLMYDKICLSVLAMGVEKYRYVTDFICIISSMVDPFLRKNTEEQSNQASQAVPTPTPAQPVVASQSPTPPAKQVVPKGKTISLRTILFGCLGFFVVLVGIGALVLYMMVQNPDQYANIGLDRATIQVLLQTFALLFF